MPVKIRKAGPAQLRDLVTREPVAFGTERRSNNGGLYTLERYEPEGGGFIVVIAAGKRGKVNEEEFRLPFFKLEVS